MTKDHDFKALVRARMAKTGESYATARRQLRRDAAAPPIPADPVTSLPRTLLLVAQGHVDVRGPEAASHDELRASIGMDLARARLRRRHGGGGPTGERLSGLGMTLAGGHEVETIEVEDDRIEVYGTGHVLVELAVAYDLEIDADGHVFVSGLGANIDVTTPDGHVGLWGELGTVEVFTGDGHVLVDSFRRGAIRTGDGDVTLGLASDDLLLEVEAEKVTARGPITLTEADGRWIAGVGPASRDRIAVSTTGGVTLVRREHGRGRHESRS